MCVDCRQLCLDALVEEGDENFDWRLSFGEFKRLLSQSFQPSVKGELLVESDWKLLSKLRRQKNLQSYFYFSSQIETLSLTGDRVSLRCLSSK